MDRTSKHASTKNSLPLLPIWQSPICMTFSVQGTQGKSPTGQLWPSPYRFSLARLSKLPFQSAGGNIDGVEVAVRAADISYAGNYGRG
jgi:hypothetical protein